MRPTGQNIASAIQEWIREEIKRSASIRHDLGKFFFAVTSGTAGVIISIEKLSGSAKLDKNLGISLVLFFAAMIVALIMAIGLAISNQVNNESIYETRDLLTI